MTTLNRRELLARALCLGGATALAPALAHGAGSCVAPDSEGLRASLNYTDTAAEPARSCASCAFFTADPATPGCGHCAILSGPADAGGHCESWSPPS